MEIEIWKEVFYILNFTLDNTDLRLDMRDSLKGFLLSRSGDEQISANKLRTYPMERQSRLSETLRAAYLGKQ